MSQPKTGDGLIVMLLALDTTNDELVEQMKVMKAARDGSPHANIVCLISGFDDDPRELYEIIEARAFCRRLVTTGYISWLSFSDTFPNPGVAFGAAEIILCSEGRLRRTMEWTRALHEELWQKWCESNSKADALMSL